MTTVIRSAPRCRPLLALPVALALAACDPDGGQDRPQRVPLNAAATLVTAQCGRDADFVTAPDSVAPTAEISPGVVVTVHPRRESRGNSSADLNAGNLIARFVNTGDTDYDDWALPAGGTSCLVFALRGGTRPEARFVSSDGTKDVRARASYRYHHQDHGRDSAAFRWQSATPPPSAPNPLMPIGLEGERSAGLFRFAARRTTFAAMSLEGSVWVTCASNGCCEVMYD